MQPCSAQTSRTILTLDTLPLDQLSPFLVVRILLNVGPRGRLVISVVAVICCVAESDCA